MTNRHTKIMADTGYITIAEEPTGHWTVEVQLVDNNVWLTKNEIARLFHVFVAKVEASMRSIFKNEILFEADVTRQVGYERHGKRCSYTLYNLEAILFLSYRISSHEARAFRRWIMNVLCAYSLRRQHTKAPVLLVYKYDENQPSMFVN